MAKRGTSRSFLKDTQRAIRNMEDAAEDVFRNGSLAFYDELRKATPVDTGNLRDAWTATTNGLTTTVTGPGDTPSKSGPRSGEETSISNIMNAEIGDKINYMNSATYFLRIERGFTGYDSLGRYYNQPGRWFAAKVGARYRSIMRATAARFRMQVK